MAPSVPNQHKTHSIFGLLHNNDSAKKYARFYPLHTLTRTKKTSYILMYNSTYNNVFLKIIYDGVLGLQTAYQSCVLFMQQNLKTFAEQSQIPP